MKTNKLTKRRILKSAIIGSAAAVALISIRPAHASSTAASTALADMNTAVTSIGSFVSSAIPVAASVAVASVGLLIFKRIGQA